VGRKLTSAKISSLKRCLLVMLRSRYVSFISLVSAKIDYLESFRMVDFGTYFSFRMDARTSTSSRNFYFSLSV